MSAHGTSDRALDLHLEDLLEDALSERALRRRPYCGVLARPGAIARPPVGARDNQGLTAWAGNQLSSLLLGRVLKHNPHMSHRAGALSPYGCALLTLVSVIADPAVSSLLAEALACTDINHAAVTADGPDGVLVFVVAGTFDDLALQGVITAIMPHVVKLVQNPPPPRPAPQLGRADVRPPLDLSRIKMRR
jgi:hypothetical protein